MLVKFSYKIPSTHQILLLVCRTFFIRTSTLIAHRLGFWTKLFQPGKFYFLCAIFLTFKKAIYCLLPTYMSFISCCAICTFVNFYLLTEHQFTYFSENNLSRDNIFVISTFKFYLLCCHSSVDSINKRVVPCAHGLTIRVLYKMLQHTFQNLAILDY